MSTTQTLLTFEEFEKLPEYTGKQELLRGEVIELPPAKYNHHLVAQAMFMRLRAALAEAEGHRQTRDLGEAYFEIGYKLSDKSYVIPDVSITYAGQPVDEYLLGAPLLAIEVISPSNRAEHIQTKIDLYFEHGAREVWVLYPRTRQVVVHAASSAKTLSNSDALETPLLPGFSLKVAEIFG